MSILAVIPDIWSQCPFHVPGSAACDGAEEDFFRGSELRLDRLEI
jgi:hypothetical protein